MAAFARFVVGATALVTIWYFLGAVMEPEALGMSMLVLLIVAILFWIL